MLKPPPPSIAAPRAETPPRSLAAVANGAFRYWRVAAAVLAAAVVLGILAALLVPPAYRAEARLLTLNAGVYDMQAENGAANPAQAMNPTDIANVEIQLLDSAELHRAVARRMLGGDASPRAVAEQATRLEAKLHVTKVTDANVIELTYVDRDPDVAARTLQSLIDAYFAARAEVLTSGRLGFLDGQLAKAQAQLDEVDRAMVVVQRDNNVVDIAAQVAGAVQQSDTLTKARLDADAALADGRRSVESLRRGTATIPRQVELYTDNSEAARSVGEMQTSLLQLRARRADIASRYMAGSPQVQQLDKQIAGVEAAIERQRGQLVATRRVGRNQAYDTARDQLVQAEAVTAGNAARRSVLQSQEQASSARMAQLIGVSAQLARLKLQHDILSDAVRSIAARVEQARLQQSQAASAASTNVRVVEAPVPPSRRSNPPLLFVVAGLVIGLVLAAIAVVVLASLRSTFLSADEASRALDLPVLPVGTAAGDQHRAYDMLAGTLAGQGGVGPDGGGATVLVLAPQSRTDPQRVAMGLGPVLSRRAPGDTILVRFADGAPVPADASALEFHPWHGIATTVIGTEALRRADAAGDLLHQLRRRYAHVVVTAPPTTLAGEGVALAPLADAVLVVLGADRTDGGAAASLVQAARDGGGRLLGAVLLDVRSYLPSWLARPLGGGATA